MDYLESHNKRCNKVTKRMIIGFTLLFIPIVYMTFIPFGVVFQIIALVFLILSALVGYRIVQRSESSEDNSLFF